VVIEQPASIDDKELVQRIRQGETALYELLMRRYNQRLYRVTRSVITDNTQAEDVVQEAWVRAYEHLHQFEGRSQFSTWVTRIAFYEALARARQGRRFAPVEDAAGDIVREVSRRSMEDTPESLAMREELRNILERAIDTLPETYRTVFVLREVEQLSTEATADCLGLSPEAVKTRLHRSRALLRKDLTDRIGETATQAYAFMGQRCDRTVESVLRRIGAAR
jgi:RNA polymerase sigma-70 factor (ECF subfamily)